MSDLTCNVDGCDGVVQNKRRGLCRPCYQRLMKRGTTAKFVPNKELKCEIDGCTNLRYARTLCHGHHQMLNRRGSIDRPLRSRRSAEERFWALVTKTETCWIFGRLKPNGYGAFSAYGHSATAHRFAYELMVGPIPDGLSIDHLCRRPACVNPAHLEAVTQWENVMRSDGVSALNARKTHCLRGHPFSDDNTYYAKGGQRHCKECSRIRGRERYARLQKGSGS